MASLLIEKDVDIIATDSNMQTVLHLTASRKPGYWLLLENGASTDVQDDTRRTVLHDIIFKSREPGMGIL